jgi:lipid A disaccharide synthetase
VYYIPPNEWLWSTSRTQTIVDTCDAILTVYPGEVSLTF